ncbi:MAG: hypothetical protein M3460_10010 [Actinomycetota bacterium]|nr:hypothetical protein [Actinomycetota bacterium]
MSEPEHNLLELDRTDDPRGGAVAWALMAVAAVLIIGIILAVIWVRSTAW